MITLNPHAGFCIRDDINSLSLQGRRRELQAAIQAHFKDWLLTSGNMRQVYDLARIENGGVAGAASEGAA